MPLLKTPHMPFEGFALLWRAAAILSAVAIALAVWRGSVDVLPLAASAETTLAEFRLLADSDLLSDRGGGLDGLRARLELIRSDIEPASRTMAWIGSFSPALLWIPTASQELATWPALSRRVREDLNAATTLLDASSELLEVYDYARSSLVSPGVDPSLRGLKSRVEELRPAFLSAASSASKGARMEESYGLALELSPLRKAVKPLAVVEDRLVAASRVGAEVSALLGELLEIGERARPLIGQFALDGYQDGRLTSETFKTSLSEIDLHTRAAMARAGEVTKLVDEFGEGDYLLPRLESLGGVLEAMLLVNQAGTLGLAAFDAAFEGTEGADSGPLGEGKLLRAVFEELDSRADDMKKAVAHLDEARAVLDGLGATEGGAPLVDSLSSLTRYVTILRAGFQLMRGLAPVGRELLGPGPPRRILVLGQSADELRATGGFVSSVWVVTLDDGQLKSVKYQDSVRVDDWERLMLYPKAPLGLEERMNAWVWLLRDVSRDPDFPLTARTAAEMYRLGQRQEVDGVVAINQWTLLRLVEALGSIPAPVDKEPITPRNLLQVLERGTDKHGRAYMDVVMQGVLEALSSKMPLSRLVLLASSVYQTLQERNALVFLNEPKLQSVVHEYGWDGSVRQNGADFLYVVDSNVGWSKSDRNVERQVSYDVDLTREPRPRITLTLRYNNHSGPGSPPCEPQWRNRGTDYSQQKNACYWNFVRVYMPRGTRILSATELPLPAESVSVEIGRGVPGEDTGRISSSHSKTVFSGLSIVGAGESKEVSLVYDLPASAVTREDGRIGYQLLIQKQPGISQRDFLVSFRVPEGYDLVSNSVPPVRSGNSHAAFKLTLTEDLLFSVEFGRVGDVDG